MSIASVGGTFGYVDPTTVAGPGRTQPVQSDAVDPTSNQSTASQPTTPTPSPASLSAPVSPPLTSGQPTFATDTATQLLKVQETAFASTT